MAKTDNARFIYRNNPLIEVTCQLRFPTILKILSRPPVRFQEEVRPQFPVFGMAKENRGFTFLSEDRNWQLMLQNEFLALTVRRYDRWEEFREHLEGPIAALTKFYAPPFFSRVGLRYCNLIRKSTLSLDSDNWGKLLNQQATGSLSWPDFAGEVAGTRNEVLIKLNGNSSLCRVNHGLVNVQGTDERCYLIDNDFFVDGRTELNTAMESADNLHKEASRFFRWWVTDKLHKAMDPQAA